MRESIKKVLFYLEKGSGIGSILRELFEDFFKVIIDWVLVSLNRLDHRGILVYLKARNTRSARNIQRIKLSFRKNFETLTKEVRLC